MGSFPFVMAMEKRSRMIGRILKWTGIALGSLVLLTMLAAIALYFLFDWNWLKGRATAELSEAAGRQIDITGDIQGEWSFSPFIAIHGIRLENAEWGSAPLMADIGRLAFRIRLLDLLKGDVVLPELTIEGANILLEKNDEGIGNWKFGPSVAGAATEGAVPESRDEFPYIGHLSIDHSKIIYRDPQGKLDLETDITLAKGEESASDQIHLTGKGKYENQPVRIDLVAAPLNELRNKEIPYPIRLKLHVGDTSIEAQGEVTDPLNPENFDLHMALAGESMSDLFLVFRVPLPPTPDYRLEGRFTRQGPIWTFTGMQGKVGNSDLSGHARVDTGARRPVLAAELTSRRLDFKDLGGFIGAPPDKEVKTKPQAAGKGTADEETGAQRVLPDVDINLERLHAMDMRVKFQGRQILAPDMPIQNLNAAIYLDDGLLRFAPINFGIAGGTLGGTLVLNGRQKIPRVESNLTARNMALKQFFQNPEFADATQGKFGGNITLAGSGASLADVLGTSDGRVTLGMTGGKLDPLIVELIGLDIGQALLVIATPTDPYRIRCGLVDLIVEKGVAKINGLVIDTSDSNLWGTGEIDFKEEALNVEFIADPKDPSLLSANAPVKITGPIGSPDVAIDPTRTSDEGGLGEALGAIVNPIIALLPFVDLGLGEDTDCRHFEVGTKKPVPPDDPDATSPVPPLPPPK